MTSKALCKAFVACALFLGAVHAACAEAPGKFSLLAPAPNTLLAPAPRTLPQAGLNGDVRIRIDGDTAIDPAKIQLRLDGSLLGVEPRVMPDRRELIFRLSRLDANRAAWSRLLGSPFGHERIVAVPIAVEVDGKALAFKNDKPSADDEAPQPKIDLITYDVGSMWLGIITSLVVVVIIVLACACTPMMRENAVAQLPVDQRPYSLGRFQMVTWFCLILTSFLFIFVVTSDLNSITAESFVLMGISGTTALASVAIDQSKDGPPSRVEKNLNAMGIKTRDDAEKLYEAEDDSVSADTVIRGAHIPAHSASGQAASNSPTVKQLRSEYEAQVKDFRSTTFLKDLVNDANGPTIHRWQILIWTVILGAIYLGRVYANLETPTFGANLLALMGISGGVYLGFKIPEKQTTTS
jgi:hypothetical protein